MNKEKFILNIITYTPLFFIPIFILTVIIFSYQIYSQNFNSNVEQLKEDLLNSEKSAIESKVKNLSQLVVYEKSKIKKELIARVQSRVETAHEIASNIYDEYKDIKSEQDIKNIINTTLRPLKWNNDESYIWTTDYLGVHYLIENKKDIKGTSFIDFQDAKGRYIVQEEIAICKEKRKGYLWNTFRKPKENNNKQYKQIAYVKAFEPYNWCLGSAEFLDTATKNTNDKLFEIVNQVDNIGNKYVFILNSKGNFLIHNQLPQFVGEDVNITNKLVLNTIDNFINVIKGKDHASYTYEWRNALTNKIEKKYSYIKRIPNTDWFMSSGFFLSEVESKLSKQKVSMLELYNTKTKYIFYIAILIIVLSFVLSVFISKKVRKLFSEYQLTINEKNKELNELNITLEEKVKKRTIELEKINDDFEKLATTDALTDVHNRYSIMNILSNQINHSKRYTLPLSVIMIDIDYFKVINDTYGHDVGDKTLVALSSLVSISIRDVDYIGRYGGEEFIVIMPNTMLNNASLYAERLRQEVEDHSFEGINKITISMGIVELRDNENIDLMFKRLDELLYLSKNNGRNRVSF